MADTAWTMLHNLTREEMEMYFSKRAGQGFNAVQVSLLTEDDGVCEPNRYGHRPLLRSGDIYDPAAPDERDANDNYWTLADDMLSMAARYGMVVALLPTWGDKFNRKWGIGPEIFTPENAFIYGKWLGERYRNRENLIWVLGGDRPLENETHRKIIDRMAEGLRQGDGGNHLITFHPCGAESSVNYLAGRSYIDFHAIQSGHGLECYDSWQLLRNTIMTEKKPCMDMECRYEDFPVSFNTDYGYFWNDADVRQNIYWNMMEGACGFAYGHRLVWCFHGKDEQYRFSWQEALDRPAAQQMKYAVRLRLNRPYGEFRPAPELVETHTNGMSHQCAGRGDRYAYLYSPLGLPLFTHLSSLGKTAIKASWFNPRTGEETVFACVAPKDEVFVPPTQGKGEDWVLILDVLD